MQTILQWIERIIRIGILEFLAKLGLRAWTAIVLGIIGVVALFIMVTLILVALLF